MYKQLRGPERLFRLGQWAVAILFAYFLTQVGASILADLPSLSEPPSYDSFLDQAGLDRAEAAAAPDRQKLERLTREWNAQHDKLEAARKSYQLEKEGFENWKETRKSTELSDQNPEIVARARKLDAQLQHQQAIANALARTEQEQATVRETLRTHDEVIAKLRQDAQEKYSQAVYKESLKVFGIRLLFVGPILGIAILVFRRYRKSAHWPFAWGFLLFALFAFFFELVPYLPSFGGYIRYGVGAVLTFLGGRVLMRSLQQYLERKRLEQAAPQEARKQEIRYEKALEAIAKGRCPSCERAAPATEGGSPVNFCMHCGLKLAKTCAGCGLRHNAFFVFCPSCGVQSETPPVAEGGGAPA